MITVGPMWASMQRACLMQRRWLLPTLMSWPQMASYWIDFTFTDSAVPAAAASSLAATPFMSTLAMTRYAGGLRGLALVGDSDLFGPAVFRLHAQHRDAAVTGLGGGRAGGRRDCRN